MRRKNSRCSLTVAAVALFVIKNLKKVVQMMKALYTVLGILALLTIVYFLVSGS